MSQIGVNFEIITAVMSADVGQGGSFNVPYPDGRGPGDFIGGDNGFIHSVSRNPIYQSEGHFSLTFGASNITVNILTNITYPDGETVYVNIDEGPITLKMASPTRMTGMQAVKVNLGAPIASDGNGAVESQAATSANGLATGINGALATDGVATFDIPRNVVAAWTGTAVLTVTGTDEYGKTIVESSGSGTSFTGKKAFKTVTDVAVSANVTGLTVGTSKVLGLPAFLADAVDVLAEVVDGAAVSNGTIVLGDTNSPSATTGDVRGTYSPNSNPNGSLEFDLLVLMRDTENMGLSQFAG